MEENNMAKFCTSCGAQLDDNATFCTSCGAQLGSAPSAAPQGGAAPQGNAGASFQNAAAQAGGAVKDGFNKAKESLSMENIKNLKTNPNKTTLIVLGGIVIVAIIVIIVLFNLIFAHPYKGAIDNYFKAITKGDGDLYKKTVPECKIEYLEDNDDDFDADDYFSDIAEGMQDSLEDDYGDGAKISYDIKKEKKLSDKKVEDIEDDLQDRYDAKGVSVTAAYEVKIKAKIKGDDDEDTKTLTFTCAKVDGQWCIVDTEL